MRHRGEFSVCFNNFIFVKMRALDTRIRHYHADEGVELISKYILGGIKESRVHMFMELSRDS